MPRPPEHPGYQRLRSGRHSEPGRVYFLTTVTHGRVPLFARFEPAALMSQHLSRESTWPGCRLWAWVLMPDHWHGLLELGACAMLPAIMRQAKGGSARAFNHALGRSGHVWRDGYHERAIRHGQSLRAAARYLVANPMRAGLAASPGEYPFWGAFWVDGPEVSPIPE